MHVSWTSQTLITLLHHTLFCLAVCVPGAWAKDAAKVQVYELQILNPDLQDSRFSHARGVKVQNIDPSTPLFLQESFQQQALRQVGLNCEAWDRYERDLLFIRACNGVLQSFPDVYKSLSAEQMLHLEHIVCPQGQPRLITPKEKRE